MTQLVKYNAARTALAEAHAIDEVKDIRDKAEAMAAYARQAKDTDMIAWVTEIKVRAERRAGQLLAEMPKNTGAKGSVSTGSTIRPVMDKSPTLSDMGISKDQSSRWQKLAAVTEEKFEQAVSAAKEIAGEVTTAAMLRATDTHNHRAQGTGENEWYTPPQYIEAARTVLVTIDLDPASSDMAQKTVKASKYFTINDDGLMEQWNGRVWLNPPYAQPAIHNFMQKAVDEFNAGRMTEAIILTHNYTDTTWFHIAARCASAICFTRGRIGFLSPEGTKAAPTQGQAFFYFGTEVAAFRDVFQDFGIVLVKP